MLHRRRRGRIKKIQLRTKKKNHTETEDEVQDTVTDYSAIFTSLHAIIHDDFSSLALTILEASEEPEFRVKVARSYSSAAPVAPIIHSETFDFREYGSFLRIIN